MRRLYIAQWSQEGGWKVQAQVIQSKDRQCIMKVVNYRNFKA